MNRGIRALRVFGGTAATAAILTLAPGPAAQAASDNSGSITSSYSGVPSRLAIGGSFTMTITVHSTSPYTIDAEGIEFGMWNSAVGGFAQADGVRVSWEDPSTGSWRAPDYVKSNGTWQLEFHSAVAVKPKGTFTWRARITLSSREKPGTVHLMTNGIDGYSLIDPTSSQYVQDVLDYNMPQTTFAYGSGGSSGSGGTTAHTSAPAARTTHSSSAHAAAPSPTTASHSPSPSPSASPSASASAPAASPTPSSVHIVNVADSSRSSSSTLPIWIIGVLLVAASGSGLFITRRRRRAATDQGD